MPRPHKNHDVDLVKILQSRSRPYSDDIAVCSFGSCLKKESTFGVLVEMGDSVDNTKTQAGTSFPVLDRHTEYLSNKITKFKQSATCIRDVSESTDRLACCGEIRP